MMNSLSRVERNCTIFLIIYSWALLWYTSFFRTSTELALWDAYFSSPKG